MCDMCLFIIYNDVDCSPACSSYSYLVNHYIQHRPSTIHNSPAENASGKLLHNPPGKSEARELLGSIGQFCNGLIPFQTWLGERNDSQMGNHHLQRVCGRRKICIAYVLLVVTSCVLHGSTINLFRRPWSSKLDPKLLSDPPLRMQLSGRRGLDYDVFM